MTIANIIERIRSTPGCGVAAPHREVADMLSKAGDLPDDLAWYFRHCGEVSLFAEKPFGITIVGIDSFQPTNTVLYPDPADLNWEELENDISQEWRLIGRADELGQYVSIDLSENRRGWCYDSFHETHATPGDTAIIAYSFTELLTSVLNAEGWYWTADDYQSYGDAYDSMDG